MLFAEARWSVRSSLWSFRARATKRLVSGIIDCAFENSEDGFCRYCASDYPYVKFFACAATLNT
jgi:hypothetical protein